MSIGIEATLAPRLVRGFDYYNRTTFEFIADAFESAQNSIGGGGRYDQLAEELGGKPTSGIGFGSGDTRAADAAKDAVASPLLETTIAGAKGILLNVTGGPDLTLYEVNEAAQLVSESADADVIFTTSRPLMDG